MKWTALLTLVLIGLVAGDGAWEVNRVYRYKLQARTFLPSRESDNNYVGVISRAYLTIRPQSENVLIGQISQAEYGEVEQQLSDVGNLELNDRQVEYDQWRLNRLFKIHLENGAIHSLSVDRSMSDYERNQLKVVISQLQVDTNAQYRIKHDDNRLVEAYDNNAYYMTMEPIVTGNCETIYDISPLPDYLAESHSGVPMPELKEDGEFIQIVKTRNYNNCDERRGYFFDITGRGDLKQYTNQNEENDLSSSSENRRYNTGRLVPQQYTNPMEENENRRTMTGRGGSKQYTNQMEEYDTPVYENRRTMTNRGGSKQYLNRMEPNDMNRRYITGREGLRQYINDMPKDLSLSENRRIIISGSLKKYTIQSSVTTSKVMTTYGNNNNPALYDYVSLTLDSVKQSDSNNYPEPQTLMNIGNLVYTYDSEHKAMPMKTTYRGQQYGDREDSWSKCWTWFVPGSTICKREFGPEFVDIDRKPCAFLGLGIQIKCRRSFPGCLATSCFSNFIPKMQSCERTFGTDYPVIKGGFEDCLPGFYRSRCCPKSFV